MDGAGIALLSLGSVVLLLVIFIFVNLVCHKTGKPNDAAASRALQASSDSRKGTKDGNMEVLGEMGEAVIEIATTLADDHHGSSVTFGCCGGSGGDGGGGGCGGGDGGAGGGGGCGGGGSGGGG
ncbi:hypothetical protein CRG98_007418 [Punica granatum]|uniref:Uncharacterized protein n=1 Tax=Punica granatum TaxID=22663 RepID=A0A2I0KV67_PUNGR|nr:hypothetical protein CRG98_007418 [Punica granatum]